MSNYEKMWTSLRGSLNTRIRQYQNADFVTGLDEIAETELDAWQGIVQEMEGLEREYEDGQRSLNDDLRDAGLLKENSKWNEG